jgi:hypothetical protein
MCARVLDFEGLAEGVDVDEKGIGGRRRKDEATARRRIGSCKALTSI